MARVVNNKIRVGIVPLNAFTINLLKPWVLNLFIKKLAGIKEVMIRNMIVLDDHINIELWCNGTSELEIASSNEKQLFADHR